jgi:hypothetical protein
MFKSFLFLATVLALVVGMPHLGHAQSAPKVTDCGRTTSALCWEAAKTNGGLAQANIPMMCAEVYQNEPGFVLLVIYDAQGNWINRGNPRHHPHLPTHAVVCVGIESFVSKAETMIWCIDFRQDGHNAHTVFRGKPIIAQYQSGQRRMVADLRWRADLPQDTNPAWRPLQAGDVRQGG